MARALASFAAVSRNCQLFLPVLRQLTQAAGSGGSQLPVLVYHAEVLIACEAVKSSSRR